MTSSSYPSPFLANPLLANPFLANSFLAERPPSLPLN
ncbi:hypothetical protein CLOP_g11704, partial [Closterium sp. NIES-67]